MGIRASTLLLASLLAFAAFAQEEGGAPTEHAPRESTLETPTQTEEPEGPNLDLPPWLSGKTKARYEEAIKAWKDVFAAYKQGRASKPAIACQAPSRSNCLRVSFTRGTSPNARMQLSMRLHLCSSAETPKPCQSASSSGRERLHGLPLPLTHTLHALHRWCWPRYLA